MRLKKIAILISVSFMFTISVCNAKTVLTPSDFTFLGAFQSPGFYNAGLTHRYVSGQLKLYSVRGGIWSSGTRGHLIEYTPPDDETISTATPYPQISSYESFGDIYQNKLTEVVDNGSGDGNPLPRIGLEDYPTIPSGVFWDEIDQRMYWTKVVGYNNTTATSDTTIGYSLLDDSTHTGIGIGSWKISPPSSQGGVGNRWSFSMANIPQDFADAYTNGKRLGVGFGGGVSIDWNGPTSMGPTLFAINPPDLDLENHMDYISSPPVELLSHLYSIGERASRNINLLGLDLRTPPYTDTTHWFKEDKSAYGVWINTPDKHGVIAFAEMGGGNANTTVLEDPSPSKTVIAVGDAGDIRHGDLIRIATDYNPSSSYLFEIRYVENVAGNVITLQAALTGNPLIGGQVACGTWYNGGGPNVSRVWHPWYIYNPDDLALTAQNPGTYPPDQIVPAYDNNVGTPNVEYPLPGLTTGSSSLYSPRGATFDTAANRLYLAKSYSGGNTLIYVYQLNINDDTIAPSSPSGLNVL